MILQCVELKTLQPIMPLTWYDIIYLEEFRKEDARSCDLIFRDIRAILFRILVSLGGCENADNWMPSNLYVMAKRYEQQKYGE